MGYIGKCLDRVLRYGAPLGQWRMQTVDWFLLLLISALGLYVRIFLFRFQSGDFTQFLSPWFEQLKAAGGLPGIGLSLGDYTPPYLYILALLTYLPLPSLVSIKLVSCVFDFVLAVFVLKLAYRRFHNPVPALAAYGACLFLPTVILNGAFWGQCDSLYVSLLLMSLYYFGGKRPLAGMVCFSISFCLKLQSVFFVPVLVLLFLCNRVKLRHFLTVPAIYLASVLPAWIAGRPLGELLTVYTRQTETYSKISMNAPNLYIFIKEDQSAALSGAAILLCGAAALISLYLLYRWKVRLTGGTLVTAALYFAILVPFLLPHMHERYFYLADILALVLAFYRPKRFYLPFLVGGASLAAYLPFLFGHEPFDLRWAALGMGVALVVTGRDLFHAAYADSERAYPAAS